MKKIYLLALAAAFTFSGCEDFLDSKNYTGKDSSNFPVSEDDVNQMVAGVYKSTFYQPFYTNDVGQYITMANLASDDMYGGGGMNDMATQALDHLLYNSITQMESLWSAAYEGISRANSALASIDNVADEELRNQTKGELLFLRAFNYFDLAKCFGNIPMVDRVPETVQDAQTSPEQVEPKEVFKQIAADLYEATQIMPAYKYDNWNSLQYGKVSRWSAQALLARVFLYYTGFFNETSIPTAEGCEVSSITKEYVVACLEEVIDQSGHDLLTDYRSLWAYSNDKTAKDYEYVADLGDKYAEGNKEVLLAINYMYLSEWSGTQLHISNQYSLFFGVRFNDADDPKFSLGTEGSTYPFGNGWGCGPVAPNFMSDWSAAEPEDKRREASVLTMPSDFSFAGDRTDNWMEATGYHNKKMCAVRSSGGEYYSFCAESDYGGAGSSSGHYQASHFQGLTLIRFADVLLMHSELTATNTGLNRVRERAGLTAVGYSEEALRNERRWELAFEGLRWDDIRRWHIAPSALDKQLGGRIYNAGTATIMKNQGAGYSARYAATNGYYKIPQAQVELSNGSIKQNPGWEGNEGYYGAWND
ncbi:MAG: RagB/SusD family nutrient uptake outer membrane protein [Phocaeicola sp.]